MPPAHPRLCPLLIAALLAAPLASLALDLPAPNAATATTATLPSGPGSITGLVEAPGLSLFTGEVSVSVPLPLPPGRAGVGPSLALSYDGGVRNGPVGIGWSLGFTGGGFAIGCAGLFAIGTNAVVAPPGRRDVGRNPQPTSRRARSSATGRDIVCGIERCGAPARNRVAE